MPLKTIDFHRVRGIMGFGTRFDGECLTVTWAFCIGTWVQVGGYRSCHTVYSADKSRRVNLELKYSGQKLPEAVQQQVRWHLEGA